MYVPLLLIGHGIGQAERGKDEGAIASFSRAIRLAPSINVLHFAYYHRGLAHARREDYSLALADFDTFIGLAPSDMPLAVYVHRGDMHAALGEWEKAMEDYNTYLARAPLDAEALYHRGHTLLEGKRDYALAVGDFSRAIALRPGFAAAYCERGRAYLRLGRYQEAIADHTRFIKCCPRNPDGYLRRAGALAGARELERAARDVATSLFLKADGKEEPAAGRPTGLATETQPRAAD